MVAFGPFQRGNVAILAFLSVDLHICLDFHALWGVFCFEMVEMLILTLGVISD